MSSFSFLAMLARMKHIVRWGLMHNTRRENLTEHTLDTAYIAHCLALIRNRRTGCSPVDPRQVAVAAMYHDCSEILTGDLPTPVKYHSEQLRDAYKRLEAISAERLIGMLPYDLREDYRASFFPDDPQVRAIVKAADKLSALIKCTEEIKAGNSDFQSAAATLRRTVEGIELEEVKIFLDEFLPAYSLPLDELEQE